MKEFLFIICAKTRGLVVGLEKEKYKNHIPCSLIFSLTDVTSLDKEPKESWREDCRYSL